MKTLLVGVLALGSVSVSANCDINIKGNMKDARLELVREIVSEKGYLLSDSSSSTFTLEINGNQGMFQEGECVVVKAQLLHNSERLAKFSEENSACGAFVSNRWNKRIKRILKNLPVCE